MAWINDSSGIIIKNKEAGGVKLIKGAKQEFILLNSLG